MRAPIRIERVTVQLSSGKADLTVLGEKLFFDCPEAFIGKHDYTKFAARYCHAKVQYRIHSPRSTTVLLQFIYSGAKKIRWIYQNKEFVSETQNFTPKRRDSCTYCPDELKASQKAQHEIHFDEGESVLEIEYQQLLSYLEYNLGYFSTSKWSQSFTYELWPIAEWQWKDTPQVELTFSVKARDGFLGIGYKEDKLSCQLIEPDNKITELPLKISDTVSGKRTAHTTIGLKRTALQLTCTYAAK